MLQKIAITTLLAFSSGQSLTLDEITDNVLINNQSIKSLEHSLEITNKHIKLSQKWNNPTLSLGINDIQFDDPFKRDLEPMQTQYLGYSQVIPMGNKLNIQKEISIKSQNIASYTLKDKKLQLKSLVFQYGFSIVILEKKYTLLNKYLKNIQRLEELSHSLYENGKTSQIDIINLKISYSKIILKQKRLKNLINNLYLKLEELAYMNIDTIDLSLNIIPILLSDNFNLHPKVQMLKEKSLQYKIISQLELEKRTSDIKVNLTYFNRDSKYKDYANVSINIPLAIYNTEKIKSLKAKIKSKEMSKELEDIKNTFHSSVSMLQNDLDNSIESYNIIKKTILPLKKESQENLEINNNFSFTFPQNTIKNLNETILFELLLLDEMKNYFTAYSKSLYFTQGEQNAK